MKILFITDNFPPESNAPAIRTFEHIIEWKNKGYDITVITGAPNFPKGKVFNGYKNKIYQSEEIDGIKVFRVWTFIAQNKGFALRIIDFLSFMFSSAIFGMFLRKPDIIIGTSPQFFTLLSAWFLAKLKRTKWICEVRDLWPDSALELGAVKEGFLFKIAKKTELFLYRQADKIVVVTKSFKRILMKQNIPEEKIAVITNGVNFDRFQFKEKSFDLIRKHNLKKKIIFGYIGTHGDAHGLETILNAAKIIREKNIHFIFVGEGSKKNELKEYAELNSISNVTFIDSVPRDKVHEYWSILDFSIIHLKKLSIFETVIPSKMFESVAMKKPILLGVSGEAKEILSTYNLGYQFEPESADALANLILCIKKDQKSLESLECDFQLFRKKYNRSDLALEYAEILSDLK